jgi:hypothetical protein
LDYSLIALSLVVLFNSNPTDLEHDRSSPRKQKLANAEKNGDRIHQPMKQPRLLQKLQQGLFLLGIGLVLALIFRWCQAPSLNA